MSNKESFERIKKVYGIDKENILTVSKISGYIKNKLTNDPKLNQIYVLGEITNLSRPSSGHIYFDIKDEENLVKCAFFKRNNSSLSFELKNGLQVLILGSITTYEKRSNYQLIVTLILPLGEGAFYLQFKQLKEKLSKEGLFDDKYKKEIPPIPKCIGLITSKKGSVIKDILNVQKSRFPNITIKLIATLMQGEKACNEVIRAIHILNRYKTVDTIIIARGGGSIEDLMCFNDEELARTIFQSKIPIITGIGHETDHTIADFVADQRAPTPSVAAKIAVPDKQDLTDKVEMVRNELQKSYKNYIASKHKELEKLREKIQSLKTELQKSYNNFIKSKEKDGESKKYKRIIITMGVIILIIIIYFIIKRLIGN
ncbi:exodeoxyribonuclease VII large subunit [archaeon]|jgi:exodeoxyribonuclease VII large subunit|nr:exodeoxyribonuclease VII large subunit [archaeon]MBT4397114.1 exodeoxyribonuclease VII large subunit [archaeon]MBT4441580.1 exodeoxyribonuclease VII large subunit [archaeon]